MRHFKTCVTHNTQRNCVFHISLSNAFWRLLFYYFLFLAETYMLYANAFYVYRHVVAKSLLFLRWGFMGEINIFCRIQMNFHL